MLTKQRLDALLHIDPENGTMRWKVQRKGTVPLDSPNGCPVGCTQASGRVVVTIDGKTRPAARLVWLHVHGELPPGNLRHKNNDPSDIRIGNLELVTTPPKTKPPRPKAARNQTPHIWDEGANAYRVRGVSYEPAKSSWVARVTLKGKRTFLGRFATRAEAEAEVLKAFRGSKC